ncbi:MAG: thiamine pyrophosphate-binding protein [Acidobacteria bacterium]|nr:thiamine pyrophosphate-binding protein [Acidobacteriota bacterium]
MTRTAVEWFVEGLRERGVDWIATLCGHGLDPLFDAARRAGLRLIDTRNEQTAGYIAECYGRLTRRPGVCASSSGVAVVNAMTGMLNAWFDHAPMLAVSGSANLTTLGMGCFQDLDQAALARPVTKYSRLIDSPVRVLQILDEAWRITAATPQGPVHLMFPMDVQRAPVEETALVRPNTQLSPAGPAAGDVETAARMLETHSRPLILAGSGVYYAGEGEDLLTLAQELSIPVQTPIWDRGICNGPLECFLGVAGALSTDPALASQADCLILAGAAADYRVGYLQQAAPVCRLDRGWRQLSVLLRRTAIEPFTSWLDQARRLRTEFGVRVRAAAESQRVARRMHAVDIIDALDQALPAAATLILDGGSIGQWAHHLLCERRYPGYWLSCGRSGVVGYGIGGAMAARLAFPAGGIVLLAGDGAFTFTVAELECAVRQKLPFIALVADDQCWGITHSGHVRQYGRGMATELGSIRFDQLAESLGARGVRIEHASEIAPAIRQALREATVTVIHVPISGGSPA